ncbi:SDR family NAD(P)-dependent oxidoreductase [Gordonia sp. NPDC003376]
MTTRDLGVTVDVRPRRLDGVAAVVTGSTRGLGRAFAEALAADGAAVVVCGTSRESTERAVAEMRASGATVVGLAGSVAEDEFCRDLITLCTDEFGSIDVLVNNAGITRDRSFSRMTVAEFDEVVAVHLRGTFSCSSAAAGVMRSGGGGRIVNVTSGAGLFGMFGQANYAAAKAGIVGLTRVMDLELHRHGIAVNCLAPVAATDMTGVFTTGNDVHHELGFPPPESVAPIVGYLAGPESAHVHGQCLSFDGSELSVWSHPRAVATFDHESGWSAADFADVITEDVCDRPHPDRWGRGVGTGGGADSPPQAGPRSRG